jgi:hypothetical protein
VPQVLAPGASLPEVIAAINQNSSRVHSLSANAATLTLPDSPLLPPMRSNIVLSRPRNFRLTAGTTFAGPEIDLGSNDELFWVWVKRSVPPEVYFCQHERFAGSPIHQFMPIEPQWLHSALGLVTLDPAGIYQGPLPAGEGLMQIRTPMDSSVGVLSRVLVVDAARGLVMQQHVYGPDGETLIASAVAHSYRYYPGEQVALPERVTIRLPAAQLALTVELGNVLINQLPGDPSQVFALPTFPGYPHRDLSGAYSQSGMSGMPDGVSLPGGHPNQFSSGLPDLDQAGGYPTPAMPFEQANWTSVYTAEAGYASHSRPDNSASHANGAR